MAEALAALGVAANIAQFVGLGLQLISEGQEIYGSLYGARDEHHELEVLIEDIKNYSDEVKATSSHQKERTRPLSGDEKAIQRLAEECKPVADKLLRILNNLKVAKNSRFRGLQTVRQTFRSAAKKKDIQDLERRLLRLDERLRTRASKMLLKSNHSDILLAISDLHQNHKRLNINANLKLDQLREDIINVVNKGAESTGQRGVTLDSLSERLISLVEQGKRAELEQRMVESLTFDSMREREEKIKDAHARTLNWIFEEPDIGFTDWLQTGNGIYWVKGKAGSGKSTLMKYICDHEATLKALCSWAGEELLVPASYFFWNAGLPMQKSQVGLLQSLLYQVLVACPSFILEICAGRRPKEPWSRKALFEALTAISKRTHLSVKFCFFVDGLDEYEGDDEDIIRLLQDLAASPSIKICVSSRPWNAFVDAFDDSKWKLVLEELTKHDMWEYVQNMLTKNGDFNKIVEKARGVWLWVFLVVRDLLRDVKGEEDYHFLQRRLDSFPDELEKYFESILGRIDKIHREETARIFRTAVEAVRPLPVLAFKYLGMEQEDPEYFLNVEVSPISQDEAFETARRWRKLLNSRCRDLLEVNSSDSETTFLKYKVDFLHRTVRDFLRDNYQEELRSRTAAHFNPTLSLCKIILALTKGLPVEATFGPIINPLFALVDEFLYYSKELERKCNESNMILLDELDRVNSVHAQTCNFKSHWTNARDPPVPSELFSEYGKCTFLALTVQARLRIYVNEKLEANPDLIQQKQGRPLLDYALRPRRVTPAALPYQLRYENTNVDVRIVSSLVSRGSNPNQRMHIYNGQTVWGLFLSSCYESADQVPQYIKDGWYKTAEYLIDQGSRYLTVSETLEAVFPGEKSTQLKSRMVEASQRRQSQTSLFWRMLGWT
ncbi:hypothetical protein K469DRAFT_734449 [Zopfia rhizophila CBS 207.26]|uniref:Uncharacterized protein n=1 Tax=Zopfia rhizophila CBS 207.26 TaxID=1314779 RepID=A0A6A6EU20_9PEZI|nr:hypothetical protein K469DRAFT_734449 [Zopfia rhizophila CBS 207.26]